MVASVRQENFRSQLAVTANVLIAVAIREGQSRFARNRFGIVWVILEPLLFIAGFLLLRTFIERHTPFGQSFALFVITGLLVFRTATTFASRLLNAVNANKALLTYPRVKPVDLIFGRALFEFSVACVIWALVFVLLGAVSEEKIMYHPDRVAVAYALTVLLGISIGSLNAVLSALFPSWERVWSLVRLPLFLLSGIFYLPILMPPRMQMVLEWNPILHCVELLRMGTYLTYDTFASAQFVLVVSGLSLLGSLIVERAYRHLVVNR